LAVQHHVADLDIHGHAFGARVVEATRADRENLALLGLLLRGVRDDQARRGRLLGLERTDHDAVFERLEHNPGGGRHQLTSPSNRRGVLASGLRRRPERAVARGPDPLVALALYPTECEFRTVSPAAPPSQPGPRPSTTSVTGRDESAATSSGDGATSRAASSAPSAATIAPLSVHSPGLGTRSAIPAASHRCLASARSRELAPTPPPTTRCFTPCARQASTALRVSTSATASWNEAATSATGTGRPAALRSSTYRATAVFSPEKEKSKVA